MEVDIGMDQLKSVSLLVARLQNTVCEGYCTHVLHGTDTEFGNIDHVILGKGKFIIEQLLIKLYTLAKGAEHLLMI